MSDRPLYESEIIELADRLMWASRADGSGMMAGTKMAADSHDAARAAFDEGIRNTPTSVLADALLDLKATRAALLAAQRDTEVVEWLESQPELFGERSDYECQHVWRWKKRDGVPLRSFIEKHRAATPSSPEPT